MCRIYGYVSSERHRFGERLPEVSAAQVSGGPDQQSFVAETAFGIGANRLAIMDPAGGGQPYASIPGILACLNGEIYNHAELRDQLIRKGHVFPDRCDGSIIPALYQEFGPSFVERIDGMFSIAVVDNRSGVPELMIASDASGMKPLYYASTPGLGSFLFATELPALLRFGGLEIDVAHERVDQYMTVRAISDGGTLLRNVFSLSSGRILRVRAGRAPEVSPYQSRIRYEGEVPRTLEGAGAALRELLEWEVGRLSVADAKVCSVNSGGLDSSLITALSRRAGGGPLKSFHVSCRGDWPFDERAYAREVVARMGGEYCESVIDPDEIPDLVPAMVRHLGSPNGAPHALSAYRLFQTVSAEGYRVALTGEGSDELFSGYDRMVRAMADPGADWIGRYLDGMAPCSASLRRTLYKGDVEGAAGPTRGAAAAAFEEELGGDRGARSASVRRFEQDRNLCHYVLHRAEPLAMASAVEVRIPFCQPRVRDFSWRVDPSLNLSDAGRGKAVVYAAAKGLLPESVIRRPKQPFTLPIAALMTRGSALMDFCRDTLSSGAFVQESPYDPSAVQGLIRRQNDSPSRESAFTIWAVMVYAVWLQQLSSYRREPAIARG